MRNEARFELRAFLECVRAWAPQDQGLLNHLSKPANSGARKGHGSTASGLRIGGFLAPAFGIDDKFRKVHGLESDLSPSHDQARLASLGNQFFDLLRLAALGKSPSSDQLGALIEALNGEVLGVSYDGRADRPYQISTASEQRLAVESLLRYLNLIKRCGAVHAVCEKKECSTMFIRERGDRRFCEKCSKASQTYQNRKEYLRKKRMEYYRQGKLDREREAEERSKAWKSRTSKTTKAG